MSTQNNANNNEQLLLPGLLGDPQRVLSTDPRADPFMIAALAQFGLDDAAAPAPVNAESPLKEKRDYMAESEPDNEVQFNALNPDLPPIENVERRSEVIKGMDEVDRQPLGSAAQGISLPLRKRELRLLRQQHRHEIDGLYLRP